jgi:hypothetical protein
MKAILDPIDRLLLLTPWWRKLLVILPVVLCLVLAHEALSHLPGHWKLLAPAFVCTYAALLFWRGRVVWSRKDPPA